MQSELLRAATPVRQAQSRDRCAGEIDQDAGGRRGRRRGRACDRDTLSRCAVCASSAQMPCSSALYRHRIFQGGHVALGSVPADPTLRRAGAVPGVRIAQPGPAGGEPDKCLAAGRSVLRDRHAQPSDQLATSGIARRRFLRLCSPPASDGRRIYTGHGLCRPRTSSSSTKHGWAARDHAHGGLRFT